MRPSWVVVTSTGLRLQIGADRLAFEPGGALAFYEETGGTPILLTALGPTAWRSVTSPDGVVVKPL